MRRGIIRRIGRYWKGAKNRSGCVIFFDRKPEALSLYEAFEKEFFRSGRCKGQSVEDADRFFQ